MGPIVSCYRDISFKLLPRANLTRFFLAFRYFSSEVTQHTVLTSIVVR